MIKTIIVDIDGTIANVSHRMNILSDKAAFNEACDKDEKFSEMIELVRYLSMHYNIVFFTGRTESVREKTINWLKVHFGDIMASISKNLYMRQDDDSKRHDSVIKKEMLEMAGLNNDNVLMILEDCNSVVEMWRENGFRCLHVQEGNF